MITGKVTDENGEPLPGIMVFLVLGEYHLGAVHYYFRGVRTTDDRGQYSLTRVAPGHRFLILAEKRGRTIPARSQTPLNPKLRRRVPMRTWHPNAPSKESAQAVTLGPGERREGVDIEMRKSPSYCITGVAEGLNGPAALRFGIEALQPSSGTSSRGGMYVLAPNGVADRDGRFRICDLHPGTYRLTTHDSSPGGNIEQPPNFGALEVTVTDEDVHDVRVVAAPGIPLEGEVVLEGAPPDKPLSTKVTVSLHPLLRSYFRGEKTDADSEIPGKFTFPALLLDDYAVRPRLNAPGLYVKDITYGDRSVRYEPLRVGSAMSGVGLKIIVGQDGAKLSARVSDKDGAPVADARVLIIPAPVTSEGMLAATLLSGQTDQLGQYTSSTLAPGKYYVMASLEQFDPTPESMGRLWRSHHRFQEIELAPNGNAQLNLEPLTIER